MEDHWQPIESAPKDGRAVLLANASVAGGAQIVASWDEGRWSCECDTQYQPDAYTHWKPLGPGPGDT